MKSPLFFLIFLFIPSASRASDILLANLPVKNNNSSRSIQIIEQLSAHLKLKKNNIVIDAAGHATHVSSDSSLAQALSQSQDLQLNFKYDEALTLVQSAIDRVEQSRPNLEELKFLADAYLYIGYLNKNRGHTPAMQKALGQAAHYNPSLIPNEMSFPPSLTASFEQAKNRVWAAGHFGSVMVLASAPDADVFVNGTFKGKSPLKIDHLPEGPHHFSARVGGREDYRKVEIKMGENPDINLSTASNAKISESHSKRVINKEWPISDRQSLDAWLKDRMQASHLTQGCGVAVISKKGQDNISLECLTGSNAYHQDFKFSSDVGLDVIATSLALTVSGFDGH